MAVCPPVVQQSNRVCQQLPLTPSELDLDEAMCLQGRASSLANERSMWVWVCVCVEDK